jgi:hypothetical protein
VVLCLTLKDLSVMTIVSMNIATRIGPVKLVVVNFGMVERLVPVTMMTMMVLMTSVLVVELSTMKLIASTKPATCASSKIIDADMPF